MGNLKKLQINEVDIHPVVSEYETYDSDGKSISNKYANKNTVNSQMVNIANQISELSNSANALHTKLGDGNSLNTPHKDVAANIVNDIYAARDNMKQSIVTALSEKGVNASTSESIESLISKIQTIETGVSVPDWYDISKRYSNSWLTTAAMPADIDYCAVAASGDYVYCIGGYDYGTGATTNKTYRYNTTNNTWDTRANYSGGSFEGPSACVSGNYIYVCGGLSNNNSVTTVHYRYTISSNSWTSRRALNIATCNHIYEAVGSNTYIIGGIDGNGESLQTCYAYSPSSNTWTQKTSNDDYVAEMASAVIGNNIYIAGGVDYYNSGNNETYMDTCKYYNTSTDSWSTISSYPIGVVGQASGTALNGKFHVMGGRFPNGMGWTGRFEHYAYDPTLKTWTQKANHGASDGCAVTCNGFIYTAQSLGCYIP